MGILTNFLKLLKPEPNDFVDVAKHISENYDKLDKNAETTNQTLTNLSNNKLDKGTYPGNASDLNTEISKIASTTQLGRFKVGTNLRIDENGFLHGNPAVDISGKMDKYKDVTSIISDYDDIIEDGFYIARGSERGTINAPFHGAALVQVWNYGGFVYQNAVSYYNVQSQFTRCFEKGIKNTKWESIVNTANYSLMCPYGIGDLMFSVSSQHPAVRWVGTTWEKIEGRFLLATSGSNASGATGGSNTKTISKANLPNIKLQVDSFSLTTTKHIHGLRGNAGGDLGVLFEQTKVIAGIKYGGAGSFSTSTDVMAEGGGENTGTASPYTSALGSGTPLDITPSFYTVHIWKRLS